MTIDVESTAEYYKDLLIIQYENKEKARAEVGLQITTLLANDIISKVQDGYDIETAIGVQLDVLGKYIGKDRFLSSVAALIGEFFAMTSYGDLSSDEVGMSDYSSFATDTGGSVFYNDLQTTQKLNDDDYRFVLKLRILQNNIDHSHKSIDDGLFSFFGDALIMSAANNMTITYFVDSANLNKASIAFSKEVLPRPMGVGITGLIERDKKIFGFTNYNRSSVSELSTGFTNYTDGFTKSGETLDYDKVINF